MLLYGSTEDESDWVAPDCEYVASSVLNRLLLVVSFARLRRFGVDASLPPQGSQAQLYKPDEDMSPGAKI